ncbi:MAG: hypothetical protein Q4C14_02945 [Bacillota bacterium]|nr:hypothetical protein [Bacillota bacterium]
MKDLRTKLEEEGGKPVVVGIVMKLDSSGSNIISNVRTIHVRSDFAKQITDESVMYLNEDKKKTRKLFHDCGNLNVPLAGTQFGVIRSISFETENVKISYSLKGNNNILKENERLKEYNEYQKGQMRTDAVICFL